MHGTPWLRVHSAAEGIHVARYAGVRWFEVDRQDVLDAKTRTLAACGAQVPPTTTTTSTSSDGGGDSKGSPEGAAQPTNGTAGAAAAAAAAATASAGSSGAIGGSSGGVAHPLRAASWAGVSCDLCSPGWARALCAAGFDPAQPTVWVAEGLLMYLTREEVEALLREMAGGFPPSLSFSLSFLCSQWKYRAPAVSAPVLRRLA